MRSATTSSPTDTRGAVSLEVDLRTHLTDPVRLREVMVEMRERAERALGIGVSDRAGRDGEAC